MFNVRSFQHKIRHVFSLKIEHVQRFQVYFVFSLTTVNSFQFFVSVRPMYQLTWRTSCSSNVPINKSLTDLNPVSEMAIQLGRYVLFIFLENDWLNVITWENEQRYHCAWIIFVVYVVEEYFPKVYYLLK